MLEGFTFFGLLILILLSVFAGYRLGHKRGRGKNQKAQLGFSRSYFKGLNYLLNEEPDKAIDTFASILEVDSETVELHLALGNLFRKRGEVDRAIRIHQNLIARPNLSMENRRSALLELGFDYMGAGLLDRAETIFQELLLDPTHKVASLKQLLIIYQQMKDWQKAVSVAEQLQYVSHTDLTHDIAHFYCELAEMHLEAASYKLAQQALKKATQIDKECVRASLIQGRMYLAQGNIKQALKQFRQITRQDIEFISEALPDIEECFRQQDDKKGLYKFLLDAIEQGAGTSVVLKLTDMIQKKDGDRPAAGYIAQYLEKKPSLKGLLRLIDMHIQHASESARPSLMMLRNIVQRLADKKPVYHCVSCGFSGKTLFWQCPSCKNWSTVKPIYGIEGE